MWGGSRNALVWRRACAATLSLVACLSLLTGRVAWGQKAPQPRPATVAEVAKVLDLAKIPLYPGSSVPTDKRLGELVYDAAGPQKSVYGFHAQYFVDQGWKELPPSRRDEPQFGRFFEKRGFITYLSVSPGRDECLVIIIQHGNVPVASLPTPAEVKLRYKRPGQICWATDAPASETREACHKMLLAAGWQAWGQDGNTRKFAQNSVELTLIVVEVNAQEGKTMITYEPIVISAELAAPPGVIAASYDDASKGLGFETTSTKPEIYGFYRAWFASKGWKSSQTKMLQQDHKQYALFQNAAGDQLRFDIWEQGGNRHGYLQIKSAAELAAPESP